MNNSAMHDQLLMRRNKFYGVDDDIDKKKDKKKDKDKKKKDKDKKKDKKKNKDKKKKDKKKYDYSDIIVDDVKKLRKDMKYIAKSLRKYIEVMDVYGILPDIAENEWDEYKADILTLADKLEKGDPKVFNIEYLNSHLQDNKQIIVGLLRDDD
jgi:hypothetical protein